MTIIPPPGRVEPRLAEQLPLPAYRYVPGLLPHPFRDPAGHNHLSGLPLPEPAWRPGQSWDQCLHHRYAIDLFHHRFYWESHEVWEAVWLLLPRPSPERSLIQALIQVAAGVLKQHMGNERARDRLFQAARSRLSECIGVGPVVCGVSVGELIAQLDEGEQWPTMVLGPPFDDATDRQ